MKQKVQLIMVLAVLMFCNIAIAALPFRFGNQEQLNAIGVALPILKESIQEPLKTAEVAIYQFRQGDQIWTEERYSAEELWFGTQHIGAWRDNAGNVQQLARCTTILPDEYFGTDVKQSGFDLIISTEAETISTGRFISVKQSLIKWLNYYAGLEVVGNPFDVKFGNQKLAEAYSYRLKASNYYVCFFRLDKRYPGQSLAPDNWFCILLSSTVSFSNEVERYIQEALIRKISGIGKGSTAGPYSANKNRTKVIKEYPYSPIRERAKKSIEAMNDWWYMESENYIMLSNHGKAEKAAEQILNELELLRSYYVKLFPPFDGVEKTDVGVVRFFATTEEYIAYLASEPLVGLSPQQTAGIFTSSRGELVIRNVTEGESYRHDIISEIIKHEGLHQYFYLAFGYLSTSPWFNEGHATTFESSKFNKGKLFIVEDNNHFDLVLSVIKDKQDTELEAYVSQLLMMDYKAFYSTNTQFNYALAHCLVYYLHRGAPMERNQPYKDILPRYVEELARSNDMHQATLYAFADIDMKSFVRRFALFMKSSKLRQDALRRSL